MPWTKEKPQQIEQSTIKRNSREQNNNNQSDKVTMNDIENAFSCNSHLEPDTNCCLYVRFIYVSLYINPRTKVTLDNL